MNKTDIKILKLKTQYATLSRVCEYFPLKSKHIAYMKMNEMMNQILKEIEKLKS